MKTSLDQQMEAEGFALLYRGCKTQRKVDNLLYQAVELLEHQEIQYRIREDPDFNGEGMLNMESLYVMQNRLEKAQNLASRVLGQQVA